MIITLLFFRHGYPSILVKGIRDHQMISVCSLIVENKKKQLSMKYVSWIKFHFLILIRNKKHEHKSVRIKFQFLQKNEYR